MAVTPGGYADITEDFVAAHFPDVEVAVIGGSTSRGERTRTSDIDLLLIGDALFDDSRESMAATYAHAGEIFEVFAYTPRGFDEWARRGVAQHRPVIVHMLVEGVAVRSGPELERQRAHWAPILAAGPSPTDQELATRRYVITDLLDDLRDAEDPLERQVVGATLFERTAELMLLTHARWIGTGKYLPRRLREWDVSRADALARPLLLGDHAGLADAVSAELDRAGGRVQAGFVR
ncbi:nucleotidyltransferase domain-containing protein [Microbacterium sp. M28]|uniref:nucleotidyltransferase domain-containing protein n=1 Tax=Microbacterium sp. M28 TaxID=2962064 RepID=UPI0021F460EC|nr:nucleotidyltransferase domain-containing protein [Microbacterium sp. M28]UYO98258.1 nucleotidyltransferase domain-containing protein [Microbacterium sp. M28]